jgi:spoIIIJ-associated protein
MKVNANVTAMFVHPEVEGQRPTIWVDINGNDLSILIGRRSQTLYALQYITSLIVGKELGRSVPLVIDVEGYRSRRQAQLRRLARTMAEQAVKTGRRQALEPMPANERRIIHMELRNFPGVITESIGDDPHRKVTIIPDA